MGFDFIMIVSFLLSSCGLSLDTGYLSWQVVFFFLSMIIQQLVLEVSAS